MCVCAHAALLFLIYVFVIGMFAHSKRALTTTTTTSTSPIRTPQRASSCSWRRLCRIYIYIYLYLCMYAAYVLLPSVVVAVVVYILHFVFSYPPLTSVHRTFHFTSFNFSDTKTNNVLFSCYCHRLSLSFALSLSLSVCDSLFGLSLPSVAPPTMLISRRSLFSATRIAVGLSNCIWLCR